MPCRRVELLELADKLGWTGAVPVADEHTWPLVVKKTLLRRFTLEPYWLQLPERLALVVFVRW